MLSIQDPSKNSKNYWLQNNERITPAQKFLYNKHLKLVYYKNEILRSLICLQSTRLKKLKDY